MNEIRRVAIFGAGALGAYYASRFFAAGDFSPFFLASPERAGALVRDGIIVNGEPYLIPVETPDSPDDPADLVIVALKHHQLADALDNMRHVVGPDTLILSVLNGLDSEPVIAARYGEEKVLYCVSIGIDGVREGNRVVVANQGRLYFGEAVNDPAGPRVQRVQRALDRAGLNWQTPADMLRIMWWKFMMNVGVNQASAVLRAPYGVFQKSAAAREVLTMLMREVLDLANVAGINLTQEDLDQWSPVLNRLAPEAKTSMLQDIEAGRKTEVDIFAGKVVSLGHQYQIQTPGNAMMLNMIRTLEEQTCGDRAS